MGIGVLSPAVPTSACANCDDKFRDGAEDDCFVVSEDCLELGGVWLVEGRAGEGSGAGRLAVGPVGNLEEEGRDELDRGALSGVLFGFDFLAGCFGSDLPLEGLKTGAGSKGLSSELGSLFDMVGPLFLLQALLRWPTSPQLKHLADSVERKTR